MYWTTASCSHLHMLPPLISSTRFFETEGIAILTILISQYKIEVKEEPQFANESFDERKARVLKSKPGLTTTYVPT
jgi:hypothetical protein